MEIIGTLSGIIVVIAIFGGAWWLVTRARRGNRDVRERRRDPHATTHVHSSRDHDQHRDIPQ